MNEQRERPNEDNEASARPVGDAPTPPPVGDRRPAEEATPRPIGGEPSRADEAVGTGDAGSPVGARVAREPSTTPSGTPGGGARAGREPDAAPSGTPGGGARPASGSVLPGSADPTRPRPSPAREPARPVARRSSSGWKWLLTLLVLALLAGGGYYAWQRYGAPSLVSLRGPEPPPTPTGPTPDQLAARITELESRVNRLAELTGRITAAEQQVTVLADRLTTLEGAKAQAQDVDQLAQRIANLEGAAGTIGDLQRQLRVVASTAEVTRSGFARTVGTALSVRHLANAVARGGPFAPELAEVRAMTVEEPSLAEPVAALEPFAADGVPTLARLKAEFPTVATVAARAENAAQGDGLMTRLVNGAKSLVTVRLTGEAAARAGGAQAILARAETALSGNDLASAVAITGELTGPPAAAVQDWLAAARARLAVDQAVATLDRMATQRLASSKG